jgi:hypothetical protein
VASWFVERLAPADQPVLMSGLRKAALGQPVHLHSDGVRVWEEP